MCNLGGPTSQMSTTLAITKQHVTARFFVLHLLHYGHGAYIVTVYVFSACNRKLPSSWVQRCFKQL